MSSSELGSGQQIIADTCPHIYKLPSYVGYVTAEGTPRFSCAHCFANAVDGLLHTFKPSEIVENLYLDDADEATTRGLLVKLISNIHNSRQRKKPLTSDNRVVAVSKAQADAVREIIRKRTEKRTK